MKTKHVVTVGTFVGLALAATAAHAQALRPNILILLDTSGSMLYQQSNDGSPLCNNNANGQTSRVYNMKNAIRAAGFDPPGPGGGEQRTRRFEPGSRREAREGSRAPMRSPSR